MHMSIFLAEMINNKLTYYLQQSANLQLREGKKTNAGTTQMTASVKGYTC